MTKPVGRAKRAKNATKGELLRLIHRREAPMDERFCLRFSM